MYLYSNCTLEKRKDMVIFRAFALAVLECDETIEGVSVPEWWERVILHRLVAQNLAAYYCCTYSLAHGYFNCVTDHKGIWGLTALPIGCITDSHSAPGGKVYWGIIREEKPVRLHHYASVVILCPLTCKMPMQKMKQLWEKYHIGFECIPDKSFFDELLQMIPEAMVLHYPEHGEAELSVYGYGVEELFEEADARRQTEEA